MYNEAVRALTHTASNWVSPEELGQVTDAACLKSPWQMAEMVGVLSGAARCGRATCSTTVSSIGLQLRPRGRRLVWQSQAATCPDLGRATP